MERFLLRADVSGRRCNDSNIDNCFAEKDDDRIDIEDAGDGNCCPVRKIFRLQCWNSKNNF